MDARRQDYGVWNGTVLLGVQIEFGFPTLSHESHWDSHGSAKPLELVGQVPDNIEISEGWTTCERCSARTVYRPEPREYEHLSPADHEAVVEKRTSNRALLDWLVRFESTPDRRVPRSGR